MLHHSKSVLFVSQRSTTNKTMFPIAKSSQWQFLTMALLVSSFANIGFAAPLKKRLESKVQVGKEIVLSIGTHKKATKFKMAGGPSSISITYGKGIMTWTPTEEEIGTHKVVVDFRVNGKKRRVTMTTEVVRTLNPAIDGSPMPAGDGAVAEVAEKAEVFAFAKLPLSMDVNCLTMTEDGRFVLLGHQADNKISVWSVADEAIATTLDCESPGHILCRGNRAYVANVNAGKISMINTETWATDGELKTPSFQQVFLTAPQGSYFDGRMLLNVIVHSKIKLYAVDADNNRCEEVEVSNGRQLAVASYTGKYCMLYSGDTGIFALKGPFDALVQRKPVVEMGHNNRNCAPMRQVRGGEYWFGGNSVYRGLPPILMKGLKAILVIPDQISNCYYGVDRETVSSFAVDGEETKLGEVRVTFPEDFRRMRPRSSGNPQRSDTDRTHLAATENGKTSLFVFSETGEVFHCRFPAMSPSPDKTSDETPSLASIAGQSETPLSDSAAVDSEQFVKLPIAMSITAMEATEDNQHLVLGHKASDKLSVWSLSERRIVATIDCDSPGPILCRGTKVYVGNDGVGKISIVDGRSWKIEKTIDLNQRTITFMSASQGRYFDGMIAVTSHLDRDNSRVTFVDVRRGKFREMQRSIAADKLTVGYSGKAYITQSKYGGIIDAHGPFRNFAIGQATHNFGHNSNHCPLIEQVRDNEFWYGYRHVFRGLPPQRTSELYGRIAIGDRVTNVFYAMHPDKIECYSLANRISKVGETATKYSDKYEEAQKHDRGGIGIAITENGKTHLFVYAKGLRNVYYQQINAFVRSGSTAGSGISAQANVANPKPVAEQKVRTWASKDGKSKIVAKLVSQGDGKVLLERQDTGKRLVVAINDLSESDNLFLKQHAANLAAASKSSMASGASPSPQGKADPQMAAKEHPDQPQGGTKPRKWTSKTGSTVVATFVSLAGGRVSLRRKDNGKAITIPISALSSADIEFLRELERSEREGTPPPANIATAPAKVDPAPAKSSMAPAEIANATNDEAGEPTQPLSIGEPLVKAGDPFPSIDGLDPELVAIAKGIESLTHENDEIKRLERRTRELIEQGKDMTLLLPHFSWGFQTSPNNWYKAYLYVSMRSIVKLPGGEAVLPDLLIYSHKCIAENLTSSLYHTMFLLATLGHYDLIEPCLEHESVHVREAGLNGIIALMTQNVTPSQRMMDLVWKNTEHKGEQYMAQDICVILGFQRPVDDRAFVYYEKCRERMLGHLDFLAAAYPASPKARSIWDGLMESWEVTGLLETKFDEAQKREKKRRSKKPGGVATSSGKVALQPTKSKPSVGEPINGQSPTPISDAIAVRPADTAGNVMTLAPYCQLDNIPGATWRVRHQDPPTFHCSVIGLPDSADLQIAEKCETQQARLKLLNAQFEALVRDMQSRGYRDIRGTQIDQDKTIGAGVQFEVTGQHLSLGQICWYVRVKFDHPKWTFVFRGKSGRQARALELVKVSDTMRLLPE